MENLTVNEGKTAAIIAYLWIPGLIIAFIMNSSKKNTFTSFHIRQMLGLILINIIGIIIGVYISSSVAWVIDIFAFVLWILGLLAAIQGEEKTVPLLGDQFQDWFKSVG
ncbi:MAG: hypothetical protein QNJ57_04330 [Flavobacteriaceae bacterium]|nr:hypothetical protein [Flavobacteriaceae bacterium]